MEVLAALGLIVIAAEVFTYFHAPERLARWALIPLGAPIPIELTPEERDALTQVEGGGLRQPAQQRLELASGPTERLIAEDWVGVIRPARRDALIRLRPYAGRGRAWAVLRIRVVQTGQRLEARVRYLPIPLSLWIGIATVATLASGSAGLLTLSLIPLLVLSSYSRMRGGADEAASELAARLIGRSP
jgi:hypothetical protein